MSQEATSYGVHRAGRLGYSQTILTVLVPRPLLYLKLDYMGIRSDEEYGLLSEGITSVIDGSYIIAQIRVVRDANCALLPAAADEAKAERLNR